MYLGNSVSTRININAGGVPQWYMYKMFGKQCLISAIKRVQIKVHSFIHLYYREQTVYRPTGVYIHTPHCIALCIYIGNKQCTPSLFVPYSEIVFFSMRFKIKGWWSKTKERRRALLPPFGGNNDWYMYYRHNINS